MDQKAKKLNPSDFDFFGRVTKYNVRCTDGRIIKQNAFSVVDGKEVPLVWNHLHDSPNNILGHVVLEHRDDGVYGYGSLNDSETGKMARIVLEHGDIKALSICANRVKENRQSGEVYHGNIVEVSLVHSGANPEAYIEDIISHDDSEDETLIICTGLMDEAVEHADAAESEETEEEVEESGETLADIFESMTDKQKNAVYAFVGAAIEERIEQSDEDGEIQHNEGGTDEMNVFENNGQATQEQEPDYNEFMHSEFAGIIADTKRYGSLKDSVIKHAADYGIENIDWLFPDPKNVTNGAPGFIKRDTGWVTKVMGAVHHTPFSRIKSLFADITEDEARARGYMKGNLKKEEVFGLLKRTTTPTTVYKKQKLDRDDIIDITDFDVVAWLKSEMRMMLDEELARAFLIGDGRLASSDDKINESNIRPIAKEEELYAIQVTVAQGADDDATARAFIKAAIKSRKDYRGSGQPVLYTTEDMLTDMLLMTDNNGRDLYTDEASLARKLRVREIVTVPVMEDAKGKDDLPLIGIITNLADYNVGADRGGAVAMFDDFDIDYNQQKYLIETRCSGALTVPKSAIVFQLGAAGAAG